MSGSTWPPTGPTSLTTVIPSYPYEQYDDDESITAFFDAFNQIAQSYLNWFNNTPLGAYTSTAITGFLLDWIAQGLYGIARPALPYGFTQTIGPLNTYGPNNPNVTLNTIVVIGSVNVFVTSDDIFKRIITWYFFKGDGQNFTIIWLKRRVMRFLVGSSGTAPNVDQTNQIGVSFGVDFVVTITITLTNTGSITLQNAQVLQAAITSAAVSLPFQYVFEVTIINDLVATGLTNTGGVLHVTILTGWPTSSSGLAAGALWSNSGVVTVIPGITPDPFETPQYFGVITSALLLTLGGGNLPISNPGVGSGQLWNNSNVVSVA